MAIGDLIWVSANFAFVHLDMATTTHEGIIAFADLNHFSRPRIWRQNHNVGEACFNTSMTGYQEILTDPSYFS